MSKPSQPAVRVDSARAYHVKHDGEWGVFYVEHGSRPETGANWLRLTMQSTFGAAGHTWNNIGERNWRDFLLEAAPDHIARKLYEERSEQFDAAATLRSLIEAFPRIGSDLSASFRRVAAELLEEDCGSTGSPEELAGMLTDRIEADFEEEDSLLALIYEHRQVRLSTQATGMLKYLWPGFTQTLVTERGAERQTGSNKLPGSPTDRQDVVRRILPNGISFGYQTSRLGTYIQEAFLHYDTLEMEWAHGSPDVCGFGIAQQIYDSAWDAISKVGEKFKTGPGPEHEVVLGSGLSAGAVHAIKALRDGVYDDAMLMLVGQLFAQRARNINHIVAMDRRGEFDAAPTQALPRPAGG